jgi:HAD superfamily hydrolase (TIGR01509 family)
MQRKYNEVIAPKPYAVEVCTLLKHSGVPFCIATNTPYSMAEIMLKKYGFDKLYDFYIDCKEVGIPKSKPDIYYIAAKRLGFGIEEVVVFEDMPDSARTAKSAGFCVVGVYDDISKDSMPEMRKLCDDYIYNFRGIMKSEF